MFSLLLLLFFLIGRNVTTIIVYGFIIKILEKLQSYRVRRRVGPVERSHFVRFVRGDDVCWKNLTAAAAQPSPTASSSRATGEILNTNNVIINNIIFVIDSVRLNFSVFLGIGRRRRWYRGPVRRVPSLGGRVRGAFCSGPDDTARCVEQLR